MQTTHQTSLLSWWMAMTIYLIVGSSMAHAQYAPKSLNVSGALYLPTGQPVTSASVDFRLEIWDKNATCKFYEESHLAENLSQTKGGFSLQLGKGSSVTNYRDAGNSTSLSWLVFANPGGPAVTFTGCGGVILNAGDERMIRVYYNLGSGMVAMTPDVPIESSAYALIADTLQGKTASDFLQVNTSFGSDLTQSHVETVFNTTNYAKLLQLLNNTFTSSYSFNNQPVSNVGAPTAGGDAVNKTYADARLGGSLISGAAPSNGQVLLWNSTTSTWEAGLPSASDSSKLPLAGGTMSGPITMGGFDLYNTGHITMGAQKLFMLGRLDNAQEGALTLGLADEGRMFYNTDLDTIRVWNGSGYVGFGASGVAGGDLTGTYPNPSLKVDAVTTTKIADDAVTPAKLDSAGVGGNRLVMTDATGSLLRFKTCALGEILQWTGGGWACVSVPTAMGASGVTAGVYGSSTTVSQIGVNAQGVVTSAASVAINFPVTSVAGKTGAVTLNPIDVGVTGTAALYDAGNAAGELPILDGTGKLNPSVLPTGTGTITKVTAGAGLLGGGTSGDVTLSLDPANTDAYKLRGRDLSAIAPNNDEVLMWNAGTSVWEARAVPSAPVSSVAGRTGAVTLTIADIGGAITQIVASSPLTGGGTSGVVTLGLDANLTDAGLIRGVNVSSTAPTPNQVLQYNGSGWVPTTLTDNAGVTLVATTTDLTGGPINGTGTLGINTGTGADQILKLNGSAQIPAVDGSLLTSVNAVKLNGNPVSASGITTGYALKWNGSQWEPQADADTGVVTLTGTNGALVAGSATVKTISIDTGVTTGQIVQVAAGDKLPVIDGSNLTNINAVKLQSNDVLAGVPADGQVLTWNNSASRWEPKAPGAGADNLGSHIAAQNIQLNGFWLSGDGNNEGVFVAGAGNVGVGTNTPNSNVIFDVNGLGAQSALLVPRDTQGNRPAGVNGMIRYNTSLAKFEVFENNAWTNMVATPDGGITTLVGTNGALASGSATVQTISIDTGVTAGQIVQVAAGDKLPVIDGSNLTGISNLRGVDVSATAPTNNQVLQYNGSGWVPTTLTDNAGVTLVETTTDLTGGPINGTGTIGVNTGTGANQILKLNGSAQIPAVDGSLLTSVNAVKLNGNPVSASGITTGYALKWNGSQWEPQADADTGVVTLSGTNGALVAGSATVKTISIDTGVTAGQIVQVAAGDKLPVIDGSNLTNINAVKLQSNDVLAGLPADGQVLTWNNSASRWEAKTPGVGADNLGSHIAVQNIQLNGFWLSGDGNNEGVFVNNSGYVGIGTATVTAGAIADFYGASASDSAIVLPRASSANRPAGVNGMIRYNTSLAKFEVFENNAWTNMVAPPDGGITTLVGTNGALASGSATVQTISIDTGVTAGQIVQVAAGDKLPVIDGSNLTGISNLRGVDVSATAPTNNQVLQYNGSGWVPTTLTDNAGVTLVATTTDLTGGPINGTGTLGINTGVGADQILKLNGSAQIPAVDGSLLTNINAATLRGVNLSGLSPTSGQVLKYNGSAWEAAADSNAGGTVTLVATGSGLLGGNISATGTVSVDVGTGPNQIIQLNGTSQLPAVDGSQLTSVNAVKLQSNDVLAGVPADGQVLTWNNSASRWEAKAPGAGADNLGSHIASQNIQLNGFWLSGDGNNEGLFVASAGNVGVGTNTPNANAIFDINGVGSMSAMLVPRDTQGNRPTGVNGMIRYNTSTAKMEVFENNGWTNMVATPDGGITTLVGTNGALASGSTTVQTISIDTGVTAGQIVQVAAGDKLPVIDGSNLTGISNLRGVNVAGTAPVANEVLKFNGSGWAPAADIGMDVAAGTAILLSGPATLKTISVDVGIGANQIPQLNASGFLGIGTATVTTGAVADFYGATSSDSAVVLPRATTGNRPATGVNGMIRYNTSLSKFEVYENGNWSNMATGNTGDNLGNHTATLPIVAVTGSQGAPSVAFSGDTDTGMWNGAANSIYFTAGGANSAYIDSSGVRAAGHVMAGNSCSYKFCIGLNVSSGSAANVPAITNTNNVIGMAPNQSTTDVGPGLFVTAGAAGSAATDSAGGALILASGASTGTSTSFIGFYTASAGASSGTSSNTATEKMRIQGSGIVGLGTSSPNSAAILDVNGTGNLSAMIVPRDTQAARPVTAANGMIRYNTSTSKFEVYQNSNWAQLMTGSGGTGDFLANGSIPMTGAFLAATGTAATPSITFNSDNNTGFYSAGTDALSVVTGGTDRIRITSSGNVGIGTTNVTNFVTIHPAANQNLIVNANGNGGDPGAVGISAVNDADSAYVPMTLLASRFNFSGNVGIGTDNPGGSKIFIHGTTGTAGADSSTLRLNNSGAATSKASAIIFSSGTGPITDQYVLTNDWNDNGGRDFNIFDAVAGAQRMVINSEGSIGIGTSTPYSSAIFDVNGTGNLSAMIVPRDTQAARPVTAANGMIRYNTSTSKFEVYQNSNWASIMTGSGSSGDFLANGSIPMTGAFLAATGTAATPSITFNSDNNTGFYSAGADALSVVTGGADRIRVNSSGSVGVGTTSPTEKLHIYQNSNADLYQKVENAFAGKGSYTSVTANSNYAENRMVGSGASWALGLYGSTNFSIRDEGNTTSPFTIEPSTPNNTLYLKSSGRIGINTNAPNAAAILDINGTGNLSSMIVPRDTQAARPVTAVNGMIRFNTTSQKFEVYEGSWQNMLSAGGGGGGGSSQWTTTGSDIYYATGGVGVGTTAVTANTKLDVVGQIISRQNTVSSGATVDFATGNTQVLDSVGGTAITLNNMKAGGNYTLVVRDGAVRTYTFNNCNSSFFRPANGNTTPGSRTVYAILAVQNGVNMECYISWSSGFN